MPRRPPVFPYERVNPTLNEPAGAIQSQYIVDAPIQPLGGAHMGRVKVEFPLVGAREQLRAQILRMSLFPNVVNRHTLQESS